MNVFEYIANGTLFQTKNDYLFESAYNFVIVFALSQTIS